MDKSGGIILFVGEDVLKILPCVGQHVLKPYPLWEINGKKYTFLDYTKHIISLDMRLTIVDVPMSKSLAFFNEKYIDVSIPMLSRQHIEDRMSPYRICNIPKTIDQATPIQHLENWLYPSHVPIGSHRTDDIHFL